MSGNTLKFTKMHGLGNDFMVIDAITQPVPLSTDLVRSWGNRHFGIGFDQLLVVEASNTPDADFRYRIFNADGNEVEQCGNGARCFARFVHDQGLTQKTQIPVMTTNGRIVLELTEGDQVTVDMGVPELRPEVIPFISEQTQTVYTVKLQEQTVNLSAVSMGNPHAVLRVNDVETAPVSSLGAELESHNAFPQRVNVGFMQIVAEDHIRLRVFERGVGETQACGTGACAAVVAGRLRGLLTEQIKVDLLGGRLQISWAGPDNPVFMTGPTTTVFSGEITI